MLETIGRVVLVVGGASLTLSGIFFGWLSINLNSKFPKLPVALAVMGCTLLLTAWKASPYTVVHSEAHQERQERQS